MSDVLSAIRSFGFKDTEKHITVALSGGADSMALITGLNMLKEDLGLTLSALHLNHCLRGEESDRDEAFVKQQCDILGVPLITKRVDVKEIAQRENISIELAARQVRYEFFGETAGDAVATAHTADDNMETVLYRLTRATGIQGLCGIPARRGVFIRPLLCCSREDIEDFCRCYSVPFVTDSTNLTDEYTRNRIRHNVVPVLKEINPSLLESFCETVELIKDDRDFLDSVSKEEYLKRNRGEKLSLDGFLTLHRAVASRVISLFLEANRCENNNYSVKGVTHIALKGEGRFQLKGGRMVKAAKGFLFFEDETELPVFETVIKQESIENIKKNGKIHNLFLKNSLDCDKIVGKLSLRTRNAGDSITFSHRRVSKPLKKWMNEEGIAPEIRDIMPVIADDKGVVWVYGGGVDARVCPDENTKQIYRVFSKEIGGK